MNKRMWIMLIATLVVFGGLITAKWYGNKMMNQFLDNMPEQGVTTTSATAIEQEWTRQVNTVGTLAAVNGADLTTEVAGIVDKIYFDSGSEVNAGDPLISLIDSTDRAELASLQAAAKLAELERNRVQALWQRKSVSKSELDKRETELAQAIAQAKASEARLAQKTLRAPYEGQLGIRRVDIGQFVAAGDPMISLQSLDPIYLNFTLPEQWYAQIHTDQKVTAEIEALGNPAPEFVGSITAIETTIDRNTRNFAIQATIPNPQKQLRPGMYARVQINLGESTQVITVPRSAINFNTYGNSVFVLKEDAEGQLRARQRLIQTGEMRGDVIAITSGVEAGEVVASSGLLKLRNDSPVTVNNTVTPDADTTPTPDND